MPSINTYLSFDGNTEEAFNFYKSVFGGEFTGLMRWSDNPDCGEWTDADKEKVMHVALPIGDGHVLMGTDSIEMFGKKLVQGNNFSIVILPDSRDEADEFYAKLSDGGNAEMPMQDVFWGDYFGTLIDKFGIGWMIDFDPKKK